MINKWINKIVKIDGAPGITLEGKKGEKGSNGGMLFFTDGVSSSRVFSVFDIWSNETESSSPMFIDKNNYCELVTPASRDYILTHVQNVAYVYIVNAVIDKNSLITKDLSKYVENGVLTQSYADKILEYYDNGHTRNECCLVTEITSLSFFDSVQSKLFDLEISKASVNLDYVANSGIIVNNQMGTIDGTAEFAVFEIIAPDNADLRTIRLEAEFYTDDISGEMSSVYPEKWSNPQNTNAVSKDYPSGYIENYSYKNNYDGEKLENFTVVIKDFMEGSESSVKIPLRVFENYSVFIYAYVPETSDETVCGKYYITDFQGNDLINA